MTPIEEEVCPAATLMLAGETIDGEIAGIITSVGGTHLGGESVRRIAAIGRLNAIGILCQTARAMW